MGLKNLLQSQDLKLSTIQVGVGHNRTPNIQDKGVTWSQGQPGPHKINHF